MTEINAKFKDMPPEKTVERILRILGDVGIELQEKWTESGIENCWSVNVSVKDAFPFFTNGKGVTKALARASAYGEFMERLQCGLFLYKFQSITRDPAMNLQSFAPDGKYMTLRELEENGNWMDHVIDTYGGALTRKKLAAQCQVYACTDEDKIWTLPFYSLFENKYVYLPAGYVEHICSANGCCAGNTREEAWVHALSEMMERRSTVSMLTGGRAAPRIPDEVIERFPTASAILNTIRSSGHFDIQVFDFSMDNGFPVVSTRIINKKTHSYIVNIAADPILEIAICRSLTEIFQGRSLRSFHSSHRGNTLEEFKNFPVSHNVLNQIENGNGLFSVDFFTEELSCSKACTDFTDHRSKSNKELLTYMLDLYRQLGKPVYVRNYSFLGFHCYQFVVPGFSETRGIRLTDPIVEYALGDSVHQVFRDVASASAGDLVMMLAYHTKIGTAFSRPSNYCGLAGLPLERKLNPLLISITLSCAAYRLGRYAQAIDYLKPLLGNSAIDPNIRDYFDCVSRYLSLKNTDAPEEKIRLLISKFYQPTDVERLFRCLDSGRTPHDDYLMKCDCVHCSECRYRESCSYPRSREIIATAGEKYQRFTDGQREEVFRV